MQEKPIKWLLNNSKSQRVNLILLIVANAIFSVLAVLFAFTIKGVIDGAVDQDTEKLLTYSVAICSLVVLQFVFRLLIHGLTEHIRGKLEMNYKTKIFSQILGKKHDKITAYHSGELMNRLTSDVSVVAEGVTTIVPSAVSAIARLVSAIIALVMIDWVFAIAFTVVGSLVFVVTTFLRGKLKSLHKRTQETDGHTRSYMQECVENLLAVKVFSVNDKIEEQANNLQEKNFKVKMKRKNYSALNFSTHHFIFSAGYVFALIYGATLMLDGGLSYGELSAILQLVNNVQVPFMSLSNVLPKYYAMIASTERLMEIENVEDEPSNENRDRDELYSSMKGLSIQGIEFTYGRDVIFKKASFYVNKGDFVVISGASGIGKSTLIKLMLGVYPVNSGEICVDTNDGRVALDVSTRRLFAFVPQGNMIFSGTLRDNVTFIKRDASEEEIERALNISCSSGFISELPLGLDTVVGENGVGLSEGQVQRIAIARALLTKAPILLLDEATSALDEETEKQLLNNLSQLKDVTLIIISHKKSALSICNRKIRIKDKKIVEE